MHIAENSNKSVVVLEQNTLTSGSTWHAAGLITTSGESEGMMKIKEYTRNVYKTFNEDNTSLVGWANTGSLMIARTPELWAQVLRAGFLLRQVKTIPYEIYHNIPPDLHPFLDMSQVLGALYLPDDGIVNPADVCLAVARRAREAGALILEHIEVTNFVRSSEGSIESVVVDREHEIECGHVVLACGQWTSQLARKHLSVHIPTAIVPHQYAIFDKISGVDNKLPVIRDYASRTYIKPEVGSFAVGTFEAPHCEMPPICKSRNDRDVPVPRDAANELYDNVPMEKQAGGLEAAMTLIPKLGEVGLKTCIHGPDTHSADHCPIVGFVGDAVPNLLVGTGFNSQGIQAGVGIGAVLSDLICDTVTIDEDFSSMDPRRFCPDISADATWCTERALEGYAETYGIHHPNVEVN
jgi:sarcosine dehydrogenase